MANYGLCGLSWSSFMVLFSHLLPYCSICSIVASYRHFSRNRSKFIWYCFTGLEIPALFSAITYQGRKGSDFQNTQKIVFLKVVLIYFSLWGKKILEQLSRPRYFQVLKFYALFSVLNRWEQGREISKPGKNRSLESSSNIFFPLAFPFTETSHSRNFIGNTLRWRSLISFGLDSVLISFWRLVFPMCTP